MKKTILALSLITIFTNSCKKKIEEKKLDLLYQIITDGRWYVKEYKENAKDVTAEFLGYEFQFYKDEKVEGIKSGTSTKKGTWSGNLSNQTILAAFPSEAGDTLKRLNATWKIVDSYTDKVVAETTTTIGKNTLELLKK